MAKGKSNPKYSKNEQMDLIDITPEQLKKIAPKIRRYKACVTERVALNAEEKKLKDLIKQFAHSSQMKRLPDGSIKFRCDDMIVSVTPQDEKVSVKENKE